MKQNVHCFGVHCFGASPTTTIFFIEEIQVIEYFDIAGTSLTSKPYSSKSVWDVTSNVGIIKNYIECASFWCESHHHCHFVEEIRVIEFYPDLRLS